MRLALGVVALLLALLDFLATPVARAQSVTLRLGLPISLDSPTGQNMREFARQVQARTSGALKVEVEGAGGRYEESEVLPAVTSGAVEIGATPLTQFTKDVPICASFLQPFLFNFDTLIEAATRPESEIRTLIDKEILRRTGTRAPITVVPWARGYRSALEEPNVGLFVAMRTPEREPLFKWVGPVTTVRTSFYSRHGADLKVTSLEEARKVAVIAVPREWFSHQVLRALGFANLDAVANTDVMVRMALTGRAPLMVADNQTLPAQLAQVEATMAQVDRHYTFMKTSSYIAFSRGTPDA
ncbi:MAG TPA: hypothetical protein VN524_04755, partial [Hyphomicrobiaceae bacterium]|nr:hypothetical protein [Hyphomicrobiaceae bacterium]